MFLDWRFLFIFTDNQLRREGSVIQRLKTVSQESKNPAQLVHNSCAVICATSKFLWRFFFGRSIVCLYVGFQSKKKTEAAFFS